MLVGVDFFGVAEWVRLPLVSAKTLLRFAEVPTLTPDPINPPRELLILLSELTEWTPMVTVLEGSARFLATS
jgi:hypothetical protein